MQMFPGFALLTVVGALGLGCSDEEPAANPGQGGQGGQQGNQPKTLCRNAEELPGRIDSDLSISGCVILDQTIVEGDAVLTIEPGTRILVRPGGFLSISRYLAAPDNGATLSAQGTADEPIVFTSIDEEPLPGDWGCVFVGEDAAATELEHVVLEYGGGPCEAVGTSPQTALLINSPARTVREVTVTQSGGHGLTVLQDATIQTFEANHFSDNELPSLALDANQLVALGAGSTFDDDDYIEVSDSGMNRDGTITAQPVPYRFVGSATVGTAGAQPEIVVAPGVRFELAGVSFVVQAGNMVVQGTEAEPVVFTSSATSPAAGDWGCLWFQHGALGSQTTGVPTVAGAVIEYAGGESCGNNNAWDTGLVVSEDAMLDDLIFNDIAGHAILAPLQACPADACSHEFNDLQAEPLNCDSVPTSCP